MASWRGAPLEFKKYTGSICSVENLTPKINPRQKRILRDAILKKVQWKNKL
jgi:hypothetical protein